MSCLSDITKSITQDCDNPIVGGYTGRGVMLPVSKLANVTQDAQNPRIIKGISPVVGAGFVEIENAYSTPFEGSASTSNADNGRIQFGKQVKFRIPLRGAGNSKDIIEPLCASTQGYIVVLEKKDRVGDGSYEVIGFQQGLKVTDDGISRNENENGGDVAVTMSCVENWFEVTLFDTDYSTTKELFESYLP